MLFRSLKQKQGVSGIAPLHEICHHGLHCTAMINSQTNMDLCPLAKGAKRPSTAMSCSVKCSNVEKLDKLGTAHSAKQRKPKQPRAKQPRVKVVQNMQSSAHAMFNDGQITITTLSVIVNEWKTTKCSQGDLGTPAPHGEPKHLINTP